VLNGTWSFGFSIPGSTPDIRNASYADIATPNSTFVPSSFDIAPPAIKGPRTTVFYRSTHACTPGTSALLRFMAVNFFVRIFVDGVELQNHTAGPYTPFNRLAPACKASGQRELALMVNNEFKKDLSPTATGGDFYFYGGIIRPIIVTELPATPYFLERVEPVTVSVEGGLIDVRVVLSGSQLPASLSLSLAFNGGPAGQPSTAPVSAEGIAVLQGVAVPDAKPWALGQGNLFTLTVTDSASGDALTVRSGLRTIGVAPGPPARLTINGKVVKLHGFNRHTLYLDTGAALTLEQEATDLALLQEVNANYVRGGHYPQSQSWLDALDAAGIAMWEEALGPGVSTADTLNPVFMKNHLEAVTSMVTTSIAHPSVILHGFFNEGPSGDVKACPGYAASAATIQALVNGSRLVTWASNQGINDKCLASAEVVSFNNYPGW